MKKCLLSLGMGLPLLAAPIAPVSAESSHAKESLSLARQLNEAFVAVASNSAPYVVVIKVISRNADGRNEPESAPDASLDDLEPELRKFLNEHLPGRRNATPARPNLGSDGYDCQGSGMIFGDKGHILTNRHVVEDAERISIHFADGREEIAHICGVDAPSDLAVLKVPVTNLKPARLGDSSKVRVGEFAIAIGAPFDLDYSITFGHVSAKGRNGVLSDPEVEQDFIQTDAQINPGSSGGPLLNIEGEVIGINTLIRGIRTGIGFAIPINRAKEITEQIIERGHYVRTWLGIGVQALREDPILQLAVPEAEDGLLVKTIEARGPARRTDLKAGDVIMAIDGKSVRTSQDLKHSIQSRRVGETVRLDVLRGAHRLQVSVSAEAMPDPDDTVAAQPNNSNLEQDPQLGISVRPLTSEQAEREGLPRDQGVWVTQVAPGSLAEAYGIKSGTVLTEINRQPILGTKQFKEMMRRVDTRRGLAISYQADGASRFEVLRERP